MDTKTCTKCEQDYPIEHFSKKGSGRSSRCSTCVATYFREYYHNNPERKEKHLKRVADRRKLLVEANRQIIWDYLIAHPCECGETDPVVLSFDHDDPAKKSYNIALMYSQKSEKLEQEIAKCTVRCMNCHFKRTASQFDWWKLKFLGI